MTTTIFDADSWHLAHGLLHPNKTVAPLPDKTVALPEKTVARTVSQDDEQATSFLPFLWRLVVNGYVLTPTATDIAATYFPTTVGQATPIFKPSPRPVKIDHIIPQTAINDPQLPPTSRIPCLPEASLHLQHSATDFAAPYFSMKDDDKQATSIFKSSPCPVQSDHIVPQTAIDDPKFPHTTQNSLSPGTATPLFQYHNAADVAEIFLSTRIAGPMAEYESSALAAFLVTFCLVVGFVWFSGRRWWRVYRKDLSAQQIVVPVSITLGLSPSERAVDSGPAPFPDTITVGTIDAFSPSDATVSTALVPSPNNPIGPSTGFEGDGKESLAEKVSELEANSSDLRKELAAEKNSSDGLRKEVAAEKSSSNDLRKALAAEKNSSDSVQRELDGVHRVLAAEKDSSKVVRKELKQKHNETVTSGKKRKELIDQHKAQTRETNELHKAQMHEMEEGEESLEKNLTTQRERADKAVADKNASSEKDNRTIGDLQNQLDKTKSERDERQSTINFLSSKYDADLRGKDDENSILKNRLSISDASVQRKENELSKLNNELSLRDADVKAKDNELSSLKTRFSLHDATVQTLQQSQGDLQKELGDSKDCVNAKDRELTDLKALNIQAQVAQDGLQAELKHSKDCVAAKTTELMNLKNSNVQAQADVEQHRHRADLAEKECEESKKSMAFVQAQLEATLREKDDVACAQQKSVDSQPGADEESSKGTVALMQAQHESALREKNEAFCAMQAQHKVALEEKDRKLSKLQEGIESWLGPGEEEAGKSPDTPISGKPRGSKKNWTWEQNETYAEVHTEKLKANIQKLNDKQIELKMENAAFLAQNGGLKNYIANQSRRSDNITKNFLRNLQKAETRAKSLRIPVNELPKAELDLLFPPASESAAEAVEAVGAEEVAKMETDAPSIEATVAPVASAPANALEPVEAEDPSKLQSETPAVEAVVAAGSLSVQPATPKSTDGPQHELERSIWAPSKPTPTGPRNFRGNDGGNNNQSGRGGRGPHFQSGRGRGAGGNGARQF